MSDLVKRFGEQWFVVLLVLALAAPALADSPPPYPGSRTMPLPPVQESQAGSGTTVEKDPWEPFNRKIFWFNDKFDAYLLGPVAKGWDFVMPRRVQTCVSNFFYNLRFPIETFNDLLQGKVQYAASDVGRFFVNTTVGVAGFFDPATSLGMEHHWEDFGQTLGWWGAGPGPYLVLPILGPSTVRDGSGLVVDAAASITPFFVHSYYLLAARSVELVNLRAIYGDTIDKAKEASVDYYTFVRNAYLQRRASLIQDRAPASQESQENLYYPEDN